MRDLATATLLVASALCILLSAVAWSRSLRGDSATWRLTFQREAVAYLKASAAVLLLALVVYALLGRT